MCMTVTKRGWVVLILTTLQQEKKRFISATVAAGDICKFKNHIMFNIDMVFLGVTILLQCLKNNNVEDVQIMSKSILLSFCQ